MFRQLIPYPHIRQPQKVVKTFITPPLSHLADRMNGWSDTKRSLFNLLIGMAYRHRSVYPSQISLAEHLRISRQYCNKLMGELKRDGLLDSHQRYNNSCVYTLNPVIWMHPFADKISHLFPSLTKIYFSLSLLTAFMGELTLTNNRLAIRNRRYIEAPLHKRVIMSRIERGPIHELIKNLPFKLDTHQKVFLCSFPYEALEYARSKVLLASNTKYPWRYFLVMAYDYCAENRLQRDLPYYKKLHDLYNITTPLNTNSADFVPPQPPKDFVPNKPQQEEKRQPTSSLVAQIKAMPLPPKVAAPPRPPLPTMKPYVRPVEEEYEEWKAFLLTEDGKNHIEQWKALGMEPLFKRQADLNEYLKCKGELK